LLLDVAAVNASCRDLGGFMIANGCARIFERLQFLRGTENLYIDLALDDPGLADFIGRLHAFSLKQLDVWARTDCDALMIMDDWGSQNGLLINPEMWRRVFKPLYREYVELAHAAGKKMFMHSDGNILQIYPDLIEIGIDALNSQIFCMGLGALAPFRGRITFWGEIDRQHVMARGSEADVRAAVQSVYENLYADGGVIAQCEFGPGATPQAVEAVYATWDHLTSGECCPQAHSGGI
jgi:uroporphyrinogen decarboxylase